MGIDFDADFLHKKWPGLKELTIILNLRSDNTRKMAEFYSHVSFSMSKIDIFSVKKIGLGEAHLSANDNFW